MKDYRMSQKWKSLVLEQNHPSIFMDTSPFGQQTLYIHQDHTVQCFSVHSVGRPVFYHERRLRKAVDPMSFVRLKPTEKSVIEKIYQDCLLLQDAKGEHICWDY